MWHFLNPYSKGLNEDHGEIKPVESGGSSRVLASLWAAPVLSAALLGWDLVPRITLFDQIKFICRGCYSFKVLMCALSVTLAEWSHCHISWAEKTATEVFCLRRMCFNYNNDHCQFLTIIKIVWSAVLHKKFKNIIAENVFMRNTTRTPVMALQRWSLSLFENN